MCFIEFERKQVRVEPSFKDINDRDLPVDFAWSQLLGKSVQFPHSLTAMFVF